MVEKIITKSFERLLDKGKHRGFVTYDELGKSLGKRNGTFENIENGNFNTACRQVSATFPHTYFYRNLLCFQKQNEN